MIVFISQKHQMLKAAHLLSLYVNIYMKLTPGLVFTPFTTVTVNIYSEYYGWDVFF